MAARRRSLVRIVLAWAFLTLAWCAFVIVLAGRLHAQTPGCYVIDRYQMLCIPSTGEIFVEEARGGQDSPILHSFETSVTREAAGRQFTLAAMPGAAATPSIILAHQKLASDGVILVHDEYDWINKGGYRNKEGEHCCGKDDCFKLRPDEVGEIPGGYSIPSHGVTVPHQDAMPSEDGHYWICRTSAKFRCFFRPYSGS
jgi:hypothetical protein